MKLPRKTLPLPEEEGTRNFRISLKIETAPGRLFALVALFQILSAVSLTVAPAVRSQDWADFRWGHWPGLFVWFFAFSLIYYFALQKKSKPDFLLLSTTALLVGWGLLGIWRVEPYFGLRQTAWVAVGALVFILGLRLPSDLSLFRKYKYLLLLSGLVLTALTLIFGTNPLGYGPKLWLGFGDIYLQPSEPLKLFLVIYLAAYFADRQPFTPRLAQLVAPTLVMAAVTLALLVVQRDLGTASIFTFIYAGLIYIATGKRRMLLISFLTLLAAGVTGYFLFDLVQVRVDSWINPWLDPSGRSYQIIQSLLSISAGGVGGRGLGLGSPYLVPISHSDFIFSTIAEEFGLIGSLGLILALILLIYRGIKIGLSAPNLYQRYLALGISIYLASQSILIIGGNIRLLPLTGVTLPFVSYGGSSLVTAMIAILLLSKINQNAALENEPVTNRVTPVFHIAALLLVGFISLALINSWWAVWRGPVLLGRTDNARRTLSDYDVPRGELVDREGVALHFTEGSPGAFTRVYHYPFLSPVLGYTDPFYGQAGAESSLDPILRGLENNTPWSVWINHLLYGQSPPGLDARISIDLDLQTYAADLFGLNPGALVLLDAAGGEILAMHSSPAYDPNTLQDDWETLIQNPNSPLLNRAVQGQYPLGTALNPFLLAAAQVQGDLPAQIGSLDMDISGTVLSCTYPTNLPTTWVESLRAGCPAPAAELGLQIGSEALEDLHQKLGFYTAPEVRLPVAVPLFPQTITAPEIAAVGQTELTISPLQLALAAASLSNGGTLPAPHFLLAAQDPQDGWTEYQPIQQPTEVFSKYVADSTAEKLALGSSAYWETIVTAYAQSGKIITWYLAGTLPGAEKPLTVVVLLETYAPSAAQEIGQRVMQAAISE